MLYSIGASVCSRVLKKETGEGVGVIHLQVLSIQSSVGVDVSESTVKACQHPLKAFATAFARIRASFIPGMLFACGIHDRTLLSGSAASTPIVPSHSPPGSDRPLYGNQCCQYILNSSFKASSQLISLNSALHTSIRASGTQQRSCTTR